VWPQQQRQKNFACRIYNDEMVCSVVAPALPTWLLASISLYVGAPVRIWWSDVATAATSVSMVGLCDSVVGQRAVM